MELRVIAARTPRTVVAGIFTAAAAAVGWIVAILGWPCAGTTLLVSGAVATSVLVGMARCFPTRWVIVLLMLGVALLHSRGLLACVKTPERAALCQPRPQPPYTE